MKSCKQPLTAEERLSWQEHKDTFEECAAAALALGRALKDTKTRELYREEYKSWTAFLKECPYFHGNRQRSYQLMDYAANIEELSTVVDTSDLNEWEMRCLKQIDGLHDRATVKERLRAADLPISEANVSRFYTQLLDEKVAAERERETMGLLGEEADDPEPQEEAPPPAETPSEAVLRRLAKREEKTRLYLARGLEFARLARKNLAKLNEEDLATTEARERLREELRGWDRLASDLALRIEAAEKTAAA